MPWQMQWTLVALVVALIGHGLWRDLNATTPIGRSQPRRRRFRSPR